MCQGGEAFVRADTTAHHWLAFLVVLYMQPPDKMLFWETVKHYTPLNARPIARHCFEQWPWWWEAYLVALGTWSTVRVDLKDQLDEFTIILCRTSRMIGHPDAKQHLWYGLDWSYTLPVIHQWQVPDYAMIAEIKLYSYGYEVPQWLEILSFRASFCW